MRRLGLDVAVLALAADDAGEPVPGVARSSVLRLAPESPARKLRRFARAALFAQHPHWGRIAPCTVAIAATLRTWRPEAVVLEYSLLATMLPVVRQAVPGVPVVVDAHNAEQALLRDLLVASQTVRARVRHWLELRGMTRIERRILPQADEVWVPSVQDAAVLAASGVDRLEIVPNAVDTDRYVPGGREERDCLVFTGVFSHLPNADAARWMVREILPVVRARRPGAHLYLVGKTPQPIAHLTGPAVTVTGFVPDATHYLARASIVVVPVRYGSGTRLKILEALAMGKSVVSTTKGAEGLDLSHGREILIADDTPAFADAVITLLRDASLRARLGAAGRALVERRYSWRAMERVLRSTVLFRTPR